MTIIASPLVPIANQAEKAERNGGDISIDFGGHFQIKSAVSSVQRYGTRRNPQSVLIAFADSSVITITRAHDDPYHVHYTATKANGDTFETVMKTKATNQYNPDGTHTKFTIMDRTGIIAGVVGIVGIAALAFGL